MSRTTPQFPLLVPITLWQLIPAPAVQLLLFPRQRPVSKLLTDLTWVPDSCIWSLHPGLLDMMYSHVLQLNQLSL